MKQEVVVNNRLQWVDIFKALVITSMVLGHVTGRFNLYIYLFHITTVRLSNQLQHATII